MYHGTNLPAIGCYLCEEEADRPVVASCRRCGAFACREHSLMLLHTPAQIPAWMTGMREGPARKMEVVCEVCHLLEAEDLEAGRKHGRSK